MLTLLKHVYATVNGNKDDNDGRESSNDDNTNGNRRMSKHSKVYG